MKEYDFIFAGGGLAGLSLAYHLSKSDLRGTSVLVIDRQPKDRNDRTLCFWTQQPTLFDDIVYRTWSQVQFRSKVFEKKIDLGTYEYKMIRALDFYRFAQNELASSGNVDFLQGQVEGVEEDADGVSISVGNQTFHSKWAFDSRFRLTDFQPDPNRYHSLRQHFKGWVIETPRSFFDPQTPTLFDFRAEQKVDFSFFYVLPFSEHRALIEYVSLSPADYGFELKHYVETVLGISDYRIVAREGGVNPLSDDAFPRRLGKRRMAIGTLGGRVKPTSGYAFLRIQKDSAAIVNSLLHTGEPFNVPSDSGYYRLCDSLMLQLMDRQGSQAESLFIDLFKNNPIEQVLRFVDETASPWENLALMASMPPRAFVPALVRQALRIPLNSQEFPRVPQNSRGTRGNSEGLWGTRRF